MRLLVIFSVIALLAITLEVRMQEPLQESSAALIVWLQSLQSAQLAADFRLVETFIGVVFTGASELIYLVFNQKIGMLAFIGLNFGGALISCLKILIAHPRPFWVFPNIDPQHCPTDYGSPSEQCLTAGVCLVILFWCWMKGSGVTTIKVALLASALFILVVYQVHLGLQFYFQVILGMIVSLWISAMLMSSTVYTFLKSIKKSKRKLMGVWGILWGCIVVSACLYLFYEPAWDPAWESMYLRKCGNPLDQRKSLISNTYKCTKFFILIGFFTGQYLYTKKYSPAPTSSAKQRIICCLLILPLILYETMFLPILHLISPHLLGLSIVGFARYVQGFLFAYLYPLILRRFVPVTEYQLLEPLK